ncbi:hypothetical protein AQ490_21670 [Wenjunlia vitaminophila]|uniref:Mycothiol-dependent maleylpyruvate isomerase metal-binding domain-containing protein n=1 Tax=Wenjunlia vitaminophila TaxID=76728 RepID=A0A0T6LTE5_WENVI|nr:maleylpyruvate isomerase family mycothiol-dependent enzyme [Wenjunlia vitaminophila]KRV49106.1 hypothetical protein AQ490_21670 [Wenjunlia vitaminophila]
MTDSFPASRWTAEATDLFLRTLDGLGDTDLDLPTSLPGWTRRHLVAHVALNAEALGRLLTWARTGKRTPMYDSVEQRNGDIEAGALRDPGDLRAWVRGSADELAASWASLPEPAWQAQVVTAQGRPVPASETIWMRAREVTIHSIDLDAGVTFADLPDGFCPALIDDIVARRSAQGDGPALDLTATDLPSSHWTVPGHGGPSKVALPVDDLAAWLTGRHTAPGLPDLPPWL